MPDQHSPVRDLAVGLATATVGSLLAFGMIAAGLWKGATWIFDRKVPR